MDSKTLMVGDWVEILKCAEKYSKIQEIYATTSYESSRMVRVVHNYNYCLREDEIQPIPITPKFLEKNGFKKIKDPLHLEPYWKRGEYEDQGLIYIWPEEHSIHIRRLSNESSKSCEINLNDIKYVHEFQHILRCCGLDDIAENIVL